MDSNYEILESLIAWIAGDESGGGDVERYLASPRVAALARVLDVAGPAPAKRQAWNRMQGWESVRWLVIGITLPENRKVGSF